MARQSVKIEELAQYIAPLLKLAISAENVAGDNLLVVGLLKAQKAFLATERTADDEEELKTVSDEIDVLTANLETVAREVLGKYSAKLAALDWANSENILETAKSQAGYMDSIVAETATAQKSINEEIAGKQTRASELNDVALTAAKSTFGEVLGKSKIGANVKHIGPRRVVDFTVPVYVDKVHTKAKTVGYSDGVVHAYHNDKWIEQGEYTPSSPTALQRYTRNTAHAAHAEIVAALEATPANKATFDALGLIWNSGGSASVHTSPPDGVSELVVEDKPE